MIRYNADLPKLPSITIALLLLLFNDTIFYHNE